MSLVAKISSKTGLLEADVRQIMMSAPVRYKTYPIPKKNGGVRIVSQPAREVKLVQRALNDVLLSHLPVHAAATAYRPGRSIKSNAAVHAGRGVILKMDFTNFFPSIKAQDWADYCRRTACISDFEEVYLTSRLLFRRYPDTGRLALAIGAPSSPAVSNALMYDFDVLLSEMLSSEHIVYTRYADDLTFSAPRTGFLTRVQKAVLATTKQISFPTLSINHSKTTVATTKFSRRVTGLTLANDGRVTVGRARKREIFSGLHHLKNGGLDSKRTESLAGLISFVYSIEPDFINVLKRKYGDQTVDLLLHKGFNKSFDDLDHD